MFLTDRMHHRKERDLFALINRVAHELQSPEAGLSEQRMADLEVDLSIALKLVQNGQLDSAFMRVMTVVDRMKRAQQMRMAE
jgi:hypothetical protein